jgi:hypothetical protein
MIMTDMGMGKLDVSTATSGYDSQENSPARTVRFHGPAPVKMCTLLTCRVLEHLAEQTVTSDSGY